MITDFPEVKESPISNFIYIISLAACYTRRNLFSYFIFYSNFNINI